MTHTMNKYKALLDKEMEIFGVIVDNADCFDEHLVLKVQTVKTFISVFELDANPSENVLPPIIQINFFLCGIKTENEEVDAKMLELLGEAANLCVDCIT